MGARRSAGRLGSFFPLPLPERVDRAQRETGEGLRAEPQANSLRWSEFRREGHERYARMATHAHCPPKIAALASLTGEGFSPGMLQRHIHLEHHIRPLPRAFDQIVVRQIIARDMSLVTLLGK
jgi:hypothetical protein